MIEPVGFSMHQDAAFLLKNDMAEHQIMQSIMRGIGREFASADLIAASMLISATEMANATGSGAIGMTTIEQVEAITHQLNYPLALHKGIERFGFRLQSQGQTKQTLDDGQNLSSSVAEEAENGCSAEDIRVFRAVDQMMPALQEEGLCAGMLLGLYRTPEAMPGLWRDRLVVVLLPVDGQLGESSSVFICLLKQGYEPHSIQGRISTHESNPVAQLPYQQLNIKSATDLVTSSSLCIENNKLQGKSFLLGLINTLPSARHWLDLDHRDMD